MKKPLTIVVGGFIVAYPLGGMSWHHLNYLLGLAALGHEVWFLEDSGDYCIPYHPQKNVVDPDPTTGLEFLKEIFTAYGLPARWCYYSQFLDRYFGLSKLELDEVLGRADLLLCVSGVTPMRQERPRPRKCAVIDTDPVFTQLRMNRDKDFVDYYKRFDSVATFGKLIGTIGCALPTHGFDWIPTQQPISLPHWPVVPVESRAFTTIGKWEQAGERKVEFGGRQYSSSKSVAWMTMLDLPRHVPWEMRLGQLAIPDGAAREFYAHGWKLFDPAPASATCHSYGDFLRQSAGEFTVAKEIYTGLPSGWFSDRSAAYLASGRPVVTQSTGFEQWLPTGEGIFAFDSVTQAAEALNRIHADYPRHSTAARRIAENCFDSRRVLDDLLDRIGL